MSRCFYTTKKMKSPIRKLNITTRLGAVDRNSVVIAEKDYQKILKYISELELYIESAGLSWNADY